MTARSRRQLLGEAAAGAAAVLALPLPVSAGGGPPARLKVVVFGAHPDDPESMAGGTAALFAAQGHEVVCLYLTRGEAGIAGKTHEQAAAIRTEEAKTACALLGARPRFLTQVDGAAEITPGRYAEVRRALEEEKPDALLAHWPVDTHRDHRIASVLAYDAWLSLGRRFDLWYGEVMTGEQTQQFVPTHRVDVSAAVGKKRAACYAHASQNPDEFWAAHERMQRFRGLEGGCAAAEAFALHAQSPRAGALPSP
jgi:LmbE family N-acetylglucosaminyl deacetylase